MSLEYGCVSDIPNIHVPFDMETFLGGKGTVSLLLWDHGCTDRYVRQYFTQKDIDRDFEVFHGNMCIAGDHSSGSDPGQKYFDGGLKPTRFRSIRHYRTAMTQKVPVVLTRPKGYIKELPPFGYSDRPQY